jgi:hypothetical protein
MLTEVYGGAVIVLRHFDTEVTKHGEIGDCTLSQIEVV